MHGGPSPGAPRGNKHAYKHGRYTAEAIARRREIRELLRAMKGLASYGVAWPLTAKFTARAAEPFLVRRRRHQPRRPPLAKIRPGSPAPAMATGVAAAEVASEWLPPEGQYMRTCRRGALLLR